MKNRKMVYLGLILIALIGILGLTYAVFTYQQTGGNNQLVLGDIYMHYKETNQLIFEDAMPSVTYDKSKYFEFTISGKNTYTKENIWYEIVLTHGEDHKTKTERIKDKLLKFTLVEKTSEGEEVLVDGMNYNNLSNTRIWVETIGANTTNEVNKTYRLYAWIDYKTKIGNTSDVDYDIDTWNNDVFGSIKVNVSGNFNEKTAPYNYITAIGSNDDEPEPDEFWPTSIAEQKANISAVNFILLPQSEIDTRAGAAEISEELAASTATYSETTTPKQSVKAWLETDPLDETKYIMYVASDGITFLPKYCFGMFYDFTNLESINFSNVNTKYVYSMIYMFANCSNLTELDLSNFDTSNVGEMHYMFYNDTNLNEINLSSFDTSNVTQMRGMFWGCNNLTSLDLSNFDTSKVIYMASMFRGCNKLTSLDLSNFDTGNVIEMAYMFYECSNLTSLDLRHFDTSKVTTMQQMFKGCTALETLKIDNWNTSKVTTMQQMFKGCTALETLKIDNWNTSNVTTMREMFRGCTALKSLDLSKWTTPLLSNMAYMFHSCNSLESLNLDNFDTSKITTMGGLFYGNYKLKSLDLSSFETGGVKSMADMFSGCLSLTSLILIDWDTSQVESMQQMFNGCSSLQILDLTSFDTSALSNTNRMFNDCSNLTTIYASSDWATENINDSIFMFGGCLSLKGAIDFTFSQVDITVANPDDGYFTEKLLT